MNKTSSRLKGYFTEKPKSNFWMHAFITLFIFKWFTPTILLMMIPFQLGLIAPETEVNYAPIAGNMTENFIKPMKILHETGRDISSDNPLVGKLLYYGLSYFTWAIWVSVGILCINLLRYGISFVYRKFSKKKERKT